MPDPAPVDPEVAAALLRSHLEDFFENSPRVAHAPGWRHEQTADPLIAIVHMPARALAGADPDLYALRLDGSHYDTWPVSATFVEADEGGWRRARLGSPAFPLLRGSPGAPPVEEAHQAIGFQFALHDDYSWPDQHTDQLICFSYNLGFYTTNHTATAEQTWRPGWDRLDATLSRIHAALNSPAYAGPSDLDVAA